MSMFCIVTYRVLLGNIPLFMSWDICLVSNVRGVHKTNIFLMKCKYPKLNSYGDIGKIGLKG